MTNQKEKSEADTSQEDAPKLHRDYCLLLDSSKYNRNWGCKWHDNAYGINGGGTGADRKIADQNFYRHLKEHKDPMALPAYVAVRLFGWALFNYHQGLWTGQLLKKIFKSRV